VSSSDRSRRSYRAASPSQMGRDMALTSPNVSSPSRSSAIGRRATSNPATTGGAVEGSRRQSRAPLPPQQLFLAAAHIQRDRQTAPEPRSSHAASPSLAPGTHGALTSSFTHSLSHAPSGTCSVSLPSGPTTSRRQRAGRGREASCRDGEKRKRKMKLYSRRGHH
jgi:hypothetical protein